MGDQRPILSICLPTNGAIQWVLPTLESIYNQGVDLSLFEVIITDNGENSRLGEVLKNFKYPNFRYIPTTDKGFLNLVTCLQKGTGLYNKMLNHRMIIKPGMLQKMIDVVNQYKDTKPVMYFLNGSIRKMPEFKECDNLDSFVYSMHLWVSWSAGIGFWDTDQAKLSEIIPNEMFPNTSLLFEHRQKSKYIIWNGVYGCMQDESGKGGYDLFHTFAVVLNDIVLELYKQSRITKRTYRYVKKQIFHFLCMLYYAEVVNAKTSTRDFIINNIKQSVCKYYNVCDYYWMVVREYLHLYVKRLFVVIKP